MGQVFGKHYAAIIKHRQLGLSSLRRPKWFSMSQVKYNY